MLDNGPMVVGGGGQLVLNCDRICVSKCKENGSFGCSYMDKGSLDVWHVHLCKGTGS